MSKGVYLLEPQEVFGRRVWHDDPHAIDARAHTMGHHFRPYLELKIPLELRKLAKGVEEVTVRARFDASCHSLAEKTGKVFNVQRPTPSIHGREAYFNCFPGFDYILHFGSVLASYYLVSGINIPVRTEYPSSRECVQPLVQSLAQGVPLAPIIILGKVDFLVELTGRSSWSGSGHLLSKPVIGFGDKAVLLGCTHTIWGEIAGRLTALLCQRGAAAIIYVGKLGSLEPSDSPNQVLATGSTSALPDGVVIEWENMFSHLSEAVVHGSHVTLPSVLQETSTWYEIATSSYRFVDPEIGWMALAAKIFGAKFSYLHIVSDNLANRAGRYGLSNERAAEVLRDRQTLYRLLSIFVHEAIARASNEV